jgi:heat shock protein HslJ
VPHLTAAVRLFALLVIVATVGACSGDATPSGSGTGPSGGAVPPLAGTSWIVVSVDGRTPVAGAVPVVTFDADRVGGTGGCNQFGGPYRLDPATGQLEVRELVSTEMGCLQAGVSAFEGVFLKALGGVRQASIDPTGQLVLDGPAGRIVLVHLEHPAASG